MRTETWSASDYRQFRESGRLPEGKKPGPARHARHESGRMNKLEQAYHTEVLRPRVLAGEVLEVIFEGEKLRLADKTFYTPDFVVVTPAGIEMHETKGFWEDDARVKFKATAERFWWYRFVAAQKIQGKWQFEEYGASRAE